MKLILKSLLQRKLSTSLLIMQFALAIALLVNTIQIARDVFDKSSVETHLNLDGNLATRVMPYDGYYNDRGQYLAIVQKDMADISRLTGVQSVTYTSQIPLRHGASWSVQKMGQTDAPNVNANAWMVGPDYMEVMGLTLLQGRWLTPMSHQWFTTSTGWPEGDLEVVLTKSLAKRVFGDENPVGQFIGETRRQRVVGVVSDFVADAWDAGEAKQYSMFINHLSAQLNYLIKFEGANVGKLKTQVEDILVGNYNKRNVGANNTLRELFDGNFSSARGRLVVFTVLSLIMAFLCFVGVYGHGHFHAHQQMQTIGVRRALGATKKDVLKFVMHENLVLLSLGCLLGVVLSFALNIVFSHYVELAKPSMGYLTLTVVLMMIGSITAVFGPARKAANVSPAVATRLQ